MKHTKGKWFWSGGELRTKQQGDKSWEGTIVLHHNKPSEEIKANCDLIASAPELLDALIDMRNMMFDGGWTPPSGDEEREDSKRIIKNVIDVIAKAEGK